MIGIYPLAVAIKNTAYGIDFQYLSLCQGGGYRAGRGLGAEYQQRMSLTYCRCQGVWVNHYIGAHIAFV